jgi:RND family efflux transporter MFP subunit
MSTVIEPRPDLQRRVDEGIDVSPSLVEDPPPQPTKRRRSKRMLWVLGLTPLVVGIVWLIMDNTSDWSQPDLPLVFYDVRSSNLPISVKERGNLESQDNVKVLCEVDDIRGDGIDGTPIIWIISNGSSVKAGELLVELDSASHLQRLDEKILERERANADMIQTRSIHQNQLSQNVKTEADAHLALRIAKLELEMFQDKENGTAHLEIEEIRRLIDDVNNEILEAQASLELKRHEKHGTESLFKMGYAGKSELDRTRLDFLQAESTYAAKLNKLKTQISTLNKKEIYEHVKQELTLKGDVETAERELEQAIVTNAAELEQAKAAMDASGRSLIKEDELLERYRVQLEKCKIYAPQEGMVAFATQSRWRGTIAVGTPVHARQHLLSLPNLKKMQVKTSVHESVLDQIKTGLPATIRMDAFSDRSYCGTVKSVAVLPDQEGWYGSDIKVYETFVTIDEEVEQLKPGMTAVVEIHVDELKNVLALPVQAIVQRQRDTWAYVDNNGNIERRLLTLGKTNTKFVEIRKGLNDGDQVVLNPMAIFEERDEQATSDDTQLPSSQSDEKLSDESTTEAISVS